MKRNNGRQISGEELHQEQQLKQQLNAPVIICDGIQTPENFGSIVRVADAVGSQKIYLLDCELDLNHKKISKISRNTIQHQLIDSISLKELENIIKNYKSLVALEITTQSRSLLGENVTDCDGVIIGHESRGIRDEVLALCHDHIHLPMYGKNGSMNISHALTVFMYEWRRQVVCK